MGMGGGGGGRMLGLDVMDGKHTQYMEHTQAGLRESYAQYNPVNSKRRTDDYCW